MLINHVYVQEKKDVNADPVCRAGFHKAAARATTRIIAAAAQGKRVTYRARSLGRQSRGKKR